MHCHDLITYLRSRAPCTDLCLYAFKEKVSKLRELLVKMHVKKFSKYFIRTLMGEFSYAFFRAVEMHPYEAIWLHPAIRTSEPRAVVVVGQRKQKPGSTDEKQSAFALCVF